MNDQPDDRPFWDLERYRAGQGGGSGGGGVPRREPAEPPRRDKPMQLGFGGDPFRLFGISLRTVILSILTLGIYRFWMITRLRQYYWGAISVGGDPLEYTGRPLEKLLGFLLAVVLLALYLGLVNLGLTYLGLTIAAEDPLALQLSLQISVLATLPLIFYALYRSQRYMLARTRWRGIRFGLAPGAWGYAARGIGLSLLTLATLGLAWPYQQFRMAKYVTDRARFGDMAFRQNGSWRELFGEWIWLYIVLAFGGLMVWGLLANPDDQMAWFLGTLALSFGGLVIGLMYMRYTVAAFRILWTNRTLGDAAFENDLSAGRVLGIYIGGTLAVFVGTALIALMLGWALFSLAGKVVTPDELAVAMQSEDPMALTAAWPQITAAATLYLTVFAVAFAFGQVFVSRPIMAAKVAAMRLHNVEALAESRQREHDRAAEAGGFADALGVDVGAGI